MDRGKPLRRKSELRNQTPLERKTPLPRQRLPLSGSGLSRKARQTAPRRPWRPTRKRRTREEVQARRIVAQRAGDDGMCEGCGTRPGREWSHRVAEGQGGPWNAANGLWLCNDLAAPDGRRGCHQTAHANPKWAREQRGWILRSTDDFLTHPAWLWGREWCLLGPNGEVWPITDIPDEENIA